MNSTRESARRNRKAEETASSHPLPPQGRTTTWEKFIVNCDNLFDISASDLSYFI